MTTYPDNHVEWYGTDGWKFVDLNALATDESAAAAVAIEKLKTIRQTIKKRRHFLSRFLQVEEDNRIFQQILEEIDGAVS